MSLRDLAAEVNMKAGSLYYHFASKDELATEVMRIGVEAIEAVVRRGLDDATDRSPAERLSIAVRIHLETLLEKRSEEHTSELQSLMRISYAVFCLKKKKKQTDISNMN